MEIIYEEYFITKEEILNKLVDTIYNNKLIDNKIITKYIINKTLSMINTNYTYKEYYYLVLENTILFKIKEIHDNIKNRQKNIYNKLTIKFNMRKYINKRLYRYPDGLRLKQLKDNFERMSLIC